jgi:hypothetical protein
MIDARKFPPIGEVIALVRKAANVLVSAAAAITSLKRDLGGAEGGDELEAGLAGLQEALEAVEGQLEALGADQTDDDRYIQQLRDTTDGLAVELGSLRHSVRILIELVGVEAYRERQDAAAATITPPELRVHSARGGTDA